MVLFKTFRQRAILDSVLSDSDRGKQDWAWPCHFCAPGLASPLPHLRWDGQRTHPGQRSPVWTFSMGDRHPCR